MIIGWCNTSSEAEAKKIATSLVSNGLAACATILSGSLSVYKWEGELHIDSEHTLMIKTVRQRKNDIIKMIKELHSYDVPEVIFNEVSGGDKVYMEWVNKQSE